jgi:small ligand-binding sensory domain FIST
MNEPFRAAHQVGGDWREVAEACCRQLGDDLPQDARLGFVYASDPLIPALDEIVGRLRQATGVRDWVGTGAPGVCAATAEVIAEGALAVLVAGLPGGAHRLFDGLGRSDGCGGHGPRAAEVALGIVHADPRQHGLPDAIAGLARDAGTFLVGGLGSTEAGAMQIAGQPTEGGLSGVWLRNDVPVLTGLTQGCLPIGPVHEITASEGPWVTRLDGRPALDVLKGEIGEILARQLDRLAGYIHAALPVEGSDRADYLVRPLLAIDPRTAALAIGADLRRGDRVLFVKRDVEAARLDLARMLGDLERRAGGRAPRGALYHSCLARGPNLFGPGNVELGLIQEALGSVPLAGFFANGEIFHNRLYAYTGVLTLFL